jgi:hypothetical protein
MNLSLKGIPTWAKVTGGLGLLVILILAYEWKKAQEGEVVEGDPCDPEDAAYDKALCEQLASGGSAIGPGYQTSPYSGTVSAGGAAASGIAYPFLPGGTTPPPADVPDPTIPDPEPEAEVTVPPEPVHPLPPPIVVAPPVPNPGPPPPRPVPGSKPGEGLQTQRPVKTSPPPAVGPGIPLPPPAPNPPPVVAPPVPPPTGWCGHPNAVGVGQPCGGNFQRNNNPPPGWHWFCCNGMLGRAPN